MNSHETALVTVLLERLRKIDSAPDDPEAEMLIRESAADQPHAVYHGPNRSDAGLELASRTASDPDLEKIHEVKTTSFLPPSLLSFLHPGLLWCGSNRYTSQS